MVAELTALRDQIDEVDKALLNLLAKRLELVAGSGRGEKPLWTAYLCSGARGIYVGLASCRGGSSGCTARSD